MFLEENEQSHKGRKLQQTHCNAVDAADDWKNQKYSVMHCLGLEDTGTSILS